MRFDFVSHTDALRTRDGQLVVPELLVRDGVGAKLDISEIFAMGFADSKRIPSNYMRTLLAEEARRQAGRTTDADGRVFYGRQSIMDANFNYWLSEMDRAVLIRSYMSPMGEGLARAFLSDKFRVIDNLDVLMAVQEGIQQSGRDVKVTSCDLTERKLYVRYSCPSVAVDGGPWVREYHNLRTGRNGSQYPLVFAGFILTNSEIGEGQFTLVPRVEVQVCSNGQTRYIDRYSKIHLGSRVEEGEIRWSEATERHYLNLIKSQAADAVAHFLTPEYVQTVVDEVNERAGTPIQRPEKAVAHVVKMFSLPEERREAILASFMSAGAATVGNLVSAFTDVAQTVESGDVAHELELQAEKVLESAAAIANA